ncbi:MAG: hypothetical protein ABI779_08615 [Acidobacteriota bacterium]
MRSSSVKTTIVALTISATLIAVTPSAQARTTRPSRETTTVQRNAGPAERAWRLMERLARRIIGGVTTFGDGTTVPIPTVNDTGDGTTVPIP